MSYRLRHIQDRVRFLSQHFKIILITGARQVGKSTLLRQLLPNVPMVTFDRILDTSGAMADPDLFLRTQPRPLILDEVQYVPQLLSSLKRVVDQSDQMGQYYLTGSHNLGMLKVAAESMAGRVGIIDLDHLTLFEDLRTFTFVDEQQKPLSWLQVYLRNPQSLPQHFSQLAGDVSPVHAVWRGGFPSLLDRPNDLVPDYFTSYIRTYIERDALYADPTAAQPGFHKFLKIMAALTAQEVNYAHFGRELGLSRSVVKRWEYVLRQTYQWREIPPYFNNAIKRATKSAKGHFTDSGLACYLLGVREATSLLAHPQLGALFESYCVNMICSLLGSMRRRPEMYHWRTLAGAEVDVILAMNGKLYPIEIKVASRVTKRDARGIMALRDTYGDMVEHGIILYTGGLCYGVNEHVTALPFNALMKA